MEVQVTQSILQKLYLREAIERELRILDTSLPMLLTRAMMSVHFTFAICEKFEK